MSTVEANVEITTRTVPAEDLVLTEARQARVGDLTVRRLLPLRLRRSVGAWCFIDHYGPQSVDGVAGMQVPPHPHIGLQTVTWLLAGNVLHRDSLGSEQMIRPGQLNLMTAGRGIAHAEESPAEHDPVLHGVQLWVALPEASRQVAPAFEHHADLPATRVGGFAVSVFMGELAGARSAATTFSPIIGAQLTALAQAAGPATCVLPLDPEFEHVLLTVSGAAQVRAARGQDARGQDARGQDNSGQDNSGQDNSGQDISGRGVELEPGRLLYVPTGHERAVLTAPAGSCVLLLGGRPLGEKLLMWWNFVARTPAEIAAATSDWKTGQFGQVGGYAGDPMPAPPLEVSRLRPPG
jgi:quercetin 2,3-dioxygenase